MSAARSPFMIFQMLEKNEFNTGSVHQMFQAASGLRERGHEVTIISREGDELRSRARAAGVDLVALPLRHEIDLKSITAIRQLVRERRPDVIHVHKGLSHSLALAATWNEGVPAFVVNRGVSFPLTFWNRPKYRTARVDRIVTVCEDIRQEVLTSGRLPGEKVEVVYAGTDVTLFDPAHWNRDEFRLEKQIPLESFLILQVGVRDWKGWRELIDAFSVVHAADSRTHLALIAVKSETERAAVLQYARDRGVERGVTPVEVRGDMPRVLVAADCVVDASWAGTGITGTIREAMALGKAVVATDCGGNRELVNTPESGWLVPAKNQAALVGALREALGDPERRGRVGLHAMERVRSGFSKELRLDRLENLYRRIVESKTTRGAPDSR